MLIRIFFFERRPTFGGRCAESFLLSGQSPAAVQRNVQHLNGYFAIKRETAADFTIYFHGEKFSLNFLLLTQFCGLSSRTFNTSWSDVLNYLALFNFKATFQ